MCPFAARQVEGGRRTRRWRLLLAGPVDTLKLAQKRPLFELAEVRRASMRPKTIPNNPGIGECRLISNGNPGNIGLFR
jgi:hypothetical protein